MDTPSLLTRISLTLFLCGCLSPLTLRAQQPSDSLWQDLSQRTPWVFLGDSNTYSGGYVAVLDAWMEQLDTSVTPELLNLGVSSETASGLSEVDHPFKRPCVHERIDKVLRMTKPGVVFVCYGMNDGIYQPPSKENLAEYQRGMLELAHKVHQSGAKLVCLTPPIFEPAPVKARGKLGPAKTGRYAYFAPAADYDNVLEAQTKWCLQNKIFASKVVDLHHMLHAEKTLRQQEDERFQYSKDGVHFGMEAHALVAEKILLDLGAPQALVSAYPTMDSIEAAKKRMTLLRNAYLSATGKNRPGLSAGEPVWLAERKVASMRAEGTPE